MWGQLEGDGRMRTDVMVDIETLGNKTNSTIFQIAAMAFDIQTGKIIGEPFNQVANIELNERPLNVSGSTLKWWLKTDKELFEKLLNSGEHSSEQILRSFYDWLCQYETPTTYLWGNGILFDNKMIQNQLESLGLSYPIFYKNDRDVRTILELASIKEDISERELKDRLKDDTLVAHDAHDDVKKQINRVVECFKLLTKRRKNK